MAGPVVNPATKFEDPPIILKMHLDDYWRPFFRNSSRLSGIIKEFAVRKDSIQPGV